MYRSLAVLIAVAGLAAAADNTVAPAGQLREELHAFLTKEAQRHWTARKAAVASLDSRGAVRKRQEYIRRWLLQAMGGFPEKTPLNARITGGFEREGYRVEHLVFESQPKFYVTANVYVPTKAQPPFPAVLGVAGHSASGKAINTYQHAWIGMVKRGFLVLAFDPPGQGERSEYFDPKTGKSAVGIGVAEHNMAGTQALLTGTTFARYETWDGIRAFDYLLTRADVDPKRIGVAGNSGGGTQSAYLAVVEPRLAATVISSYMTDGEQRWHKPGPQDAEQNFPGFLSAGLNFGDFMIAFAPKPITMLTGIRDYFPIDGARNTYAEVRRVFDTADAPGRAGFFEYDDEHGWHKPRREATYRWLTKWLQSKDDDGTEPPIQTEPEQQLNVTQTGQVATSLGGETVRSLNLQLAEKLFAGRRASRSSDARSLRKLIAARLAVPVRSGTPAVTQVGMETVGNGRVEKILLETEPGIRIPGELHLPAGSGRHAATIYINSAGKSADQLAATGTAVFAIDVRGWGESAPVQRSGGYSAMWQLAQRAMLIGRPLAGMQVFDVLRAFDYLASRPDIDASRISITGVVNGGLVALYAAALEPKLASVTSQKAVASYMTIARAARHAGVIDVVVPGVLHDFDLPDVAAAVAPRPVRLVSLRDAEGKPLDRDVIEREYKQAPGLTIVD